MLARVLSRPYRVHHYCARLQIRLSSTVTVLGKSFPQDSHTNATASILSYVNRNIYLIPNHPIAILHSLIHSHFGPKYTSIPPIPPLVTQAKNFDSLSFPQDHPGRERRNSYYINQEWMLRTHTSAHEVDTFSQGKKRWLLTADVYRRDEIDSSHFPVFHQMEGARLFSKSSDMGALEAENQRLTKELSRQDIVIEDLSTLGPSNPVQPSHEKYHAQLVSENLKHSLNGLMLKLFKGQDNEPLKVRWIDAYFPFTSPSFEVEVFFRGKWLEILGCGVVLQSTLDRAGVEGEIGWAFGLGLERIAMILFQIPDIRLFWTSDERFLSQFESGRIATFKPFSKYPPLVHDVSLWLPPTQAGTLPFIENDFCDVVRDVAGDLVEDVKLIDNFEHPKTKRTSHCYRIHYRSMNRYRRVLLTEQP
ncbi:phenylalanyl-tRNA synthetase [Gautieria morchelliformis]|nr:phenylalanyl-tRNA synthetase [Gautieria morchelliformis]